MRYFLIVFLFCSCNLSSRIPYTIKQDANGMFDYYIGKATHYAIKYDTMRIENSLDSSLYVLQKIYYGIKAEENMNQAKVYLNILKQEVEALRKISQ